MVLAGVEAMGRPGTEGVRRARLEGRAAVGRTIAIRTPFHNPRLRAAGGIAQAVRIPRQAAPSASSPPSTAMIMGAEGKS